MRVEGLATIEAPVKPSRAFSEVLPFLRSWRRQVLIVVHDLGGNPEPHQTLQRFTHTYFITGSFRECFRNGGEPDLSTDWHQDSATMSAFLLP